MTMSVYKGKLLSTCLVSGVDKNLYFFSNVFCESCDFLMQHLQCGHCNLWLCPRIWLKTLTDISNSCFDKRKDIKMHYFIVIYRPRPWHLKKISEVVFPICIYVRLQITSCSGQKFSLTLVMPMVSAVLIL